MSRAQYRAFNYSRRGLPEDVLQLSTFDIPIHIPANHVLVKVTHCALNPVGNKLMRSVPTLFLKKPHIAELDFAGTVSKVAEGESGLKVGDQIFGTLDASQARNGALAEYCVCKVDECSSIPTGLSLEESAGLGVVGLTAVQSIQEVGKLSKGQSIHIHGASGGTGVIALQVARRLVSSSGRVYASCSPKNFDLVKSLGADEVFDYAKPSYHADIPEVDVVYDCAGSQELFDASPLFLKEKGVFINIAADMDSVLSVVKQLYHFALNTALPTVLGGTPRTWKLVLVKPNSSRMAALKSLIEQEPGFKVPISSKHAFNMEGVLEAYKQIMSHRARGKVIVDVLRK